MKVKKIIALACAMVCSSVSYVNYVMPENSAVTASAAEDYTEGTYENLKYYKYSDHVEISSCDRSATEVVIPSEIEGLPVTSIGYYAFKERTALTSITIPNSVTSIGYYAFEGCIGLTSIIIPDSVTLIEDYAFKGCTSVTSITVEKNNPNYADIDGILFNKDLSEIISYPVGKKETSYKFPNSVKSIGNGAFSYFTDLTSITIPDSVTSIGKEAFYYCTGLTSITIPKSVKTMENGALINCTGLTSITIENPECEIYGGKYTKSNAITIYGYINSTAQTFAEKCQYKFVALDGTTTEPSTGTSTVTGDSSGNGTVDIADVVAIASYVGDSTQNQLSNNAILAGDVHNTGDGLTGNDVLMIQQYLAKIITEL